MDWYFDENYALHEELGDAFLLVSPSSNELVLANPDASMEVLAHRKEFLKPADLYSRSSSFYTLAASYVLLQSHWTHLVRTLIR